ncbi:MAG: hypothetical protein IT353_03125 [Gemmatimonadaceae bacterium]|nr:hypothetical protein [Gemmatimonadaceae bacterium]
MEFSKRTLAALAQQLDAIRRDSARVLLEKSGIGLPQFDGQEWVLRELERATDAAVHELMTEIVIRTKSVRADAGTKYVFDERLTDLWRCLRIDGWEADGTSLVREHPSSTELIELRDALEAELSMSSIDDDREIRLCLERSARAFSNSPPDYNASSTNIRVALEPVVRKTAESVAARRKVPSPKDKWGAAVSFLRSQDIISARDEAALTASYEATSAGAHVPKGMSEREWARMIRALDQAWLYYVLKRGSV